MAVLSKFWLMLLAAASTWIAIPGLAAAAGDGDPGRLVSVGWLRQNLPRSDLVLIDASPAPLHRQQHIAGAVLSDLMTFGPRDTPIEQVQARLRAWGVHPGQRLVLYDQGGTYMAARLFWDLVHRGFPADKLSILDGGMARWLAAGGPTTKDATPAPPPGTLSLTAVNPDVRVRLPEFLAATADPGRNAMLDAMGPSYFFGGAAIFNRAGHVPHATLMPMEDFFEADKTFKPPQEMRRMLDHLGVRPEQQVLTYCGGGGAAAVPFFALKYLLDYPRVRMFQESQLGWLLDDRELPFWTYAAPHLVRDTPWLKAWGSPMLQAFGLAQASIVDLRAPDTFRLGHVSLAVNVPAPVFERHLREPQALATALGEAGVDPALEAVIVSEGGLNERSALAFLLFERLGQARVSLLLDSTERWAELGHEVARPAAAPQPAAKPGAPAAVPPLRYPLRLREGTLVDDSAATPGRFPKVYIASGRNRPARQPPGTVIHLPYPELLNADASPRPAAEIWRTLDKAGVPRYAEIVLFADSPGEAAVNYVIFRMMGFADVKVWLR